MQLGRYQISTIRPAPILNIAFSQDGRVFAIATETGYEVWRSFPLGLMKRRSKRRNSRTDLMRSAHEK